MKPALLITVLFCVNALYGFGGTQKMVDVYIVIYATCKGKTGHAGIAVDKYRIVSREVQSGSAVVRRYDTIKTGELVYFDLWPNDDYFTVGRTGQDIPGVYYQLPENSLKEITANSLVDEGLPHKERYPCDGLLVIPTSPGKDYEMIAFLEECIKENRPFNGRTYNCTDFVITGLEHLLQKKIKAREFIPFAFSSTPNKLYKALRKEEGVLVLKNADAATKGSFLSQRVLYRFFHH